MKTVHAIAFILVIIGGLNWLLVGLVGGWDLANFLGISLSKIVYVLVGLSAIYLVTTHKKTCSECKSCTCGTCDTCKANAPKM